MTGRSVFDLIRSRRSVRRFRPDPIPESVLFRILEAARWAPSGGNSQDWSFGLVTDPARRQALSEAAGRQEWVAEAPVIIACCTHLHPVGNESDFGREVNELRWGADTYRWLHSGADPYQAALVLQNATALIPGAHMTTHMAAEGVGVFECYGYCPADKLEAVRDPFRVRAGREAPRICIGFDCRW